VASPKKEETEPVKGEEKKKKGGGAIRGTPSGGSAGILSLLGKGNAFFAQPGGRKKTTEGEKLFTTR